MLSQRSRERNAGNTGNTGNTFYSRVLLSQQGQLAKVWLAAHWQKKLKKSDVIECNLETAVAQIVAPQVKMALRTSGHLLLGIVRIYMKKVKYFLADCEKACIKMNMSFRAEVIDLPRQHFEAQYDSITLREEFHDFELENINDLDVLEHLSHHQSRPEEITLKEDYGCVLYFQDGSFVGEPEILRSHSLTEDHMLLNSSLQSLEHTPESYVRQNSFICDLGDGFGDEGNAETMIDNLLQGYQSDLVEDTHFNTGVSLTAANLQITVEPESDNPEDIFLPINDIMDEASSIEEQGAIFEPTVMSDTAERMQKKRKKKSKDQCTNITKENMLKQISSFKKIPRHLRFLPPKRRLSKRENPKTLLSAPCQCLIHDTLKTLFPSCPQPHGFKSGISAQTVPARKTARNRKKTVDTLKRKNTNAQKDLHEPKIKKRVTDANIDSFNYIQESESCAPNDEGEPSNQRAHQILNTLRESNKKGKESFSLMELCKNSTRKQAAAAFYSFLILKKEQAIEVSQRAPYEDIVATVGPRFHDM